jgi:hypothetical protein
MAVPFATKLFVGLIYPWDAAHKDVYKCVTTIFPDRKNLDNKKGFTVNHAVKSYDELLALIEARSQWRQGNVYVSMGTQKMATAESTSDGLGVKALRRGDNMATFNGLWLDVDAAKEGAYATNKDARDAVWAFVQASGMPEPTMLVDSGSGGLHVYWITDEPMPKDKWYELASGLKQCVAKYRLLCDQMLINDAARILRVPGTHNYKSGVPVDVVLDMGATKFDRYPVARLAAVLTKHMKVIQKKAGGKSAIVSQLASNFIDNAEEREYPRLPIDQIAVNCPAIAQTLADGGVGKAEPDWNLDLYTAAWTDDPTDAAHRLSKGYAHYNPAEVDKKLAEKQAALTSNPAMGWPKCSTFNHAACKTCPLRPLDKSPITFGHRLNNPGAQPLQPVQATDDLMPEGYWRNANNHVIGNTPIGPVDVLGYPVMDGGVDATNGGLLIRTLVGGNDVWAQINIGKQTTTGIGEALYNGARIVSHQPGAAKAFLMSWMTHLQKHKRYIRAHGLGWSDDGGFVFGNEIYTPTGRQAIYQGITREEESSNPFQRKGELQPWTDSLKLVYGNPVMEIVVASAFAAPLVKFACDHSVVLSVYSHESGHGKTTAMKIAQSVWGHPRLGMSMLHDTENATTKKLGKLKHLPVFWDELKTADDVDKLVHIVFATTQGRSKARLTRNSTQMPIDMSTTLLAVASNHGISGAVIRNTGGTEAGGLRVFEIEAEAFHDIGVLNGDDYLIPLNDNFGIAGGNYAEYLVRQKASIKPLLEKIGAILHQRCGFHAKERFLKILMVTIVAGAVLANATKMTRFDTDAIMDRLVKTLERIRRQRENATTYSLSGSNAGSDVLAAMQGDARNVNMVVTETVVRPRKGTPVIPKLVMEGLDLSRLKDVWMQVGKLDGCILVRQRAFNDWLYNHKYDPEQVLSLLEKDYHIDYLPKASVGVGIPGIDVMARAACILLTPHSPPSHNPSSPSSSFGSLAP